MSCQFERARSSATATAYEVQVRHEGETSWSIWSGVWAGLAPCTPDVLDSARRRAADALRAGWDYVRVVEVLAYAKVTSADETER